MALCPSVSVSVTCRQRIETHGRIELVLAMEAFPHLSYTVYEEIQVPPKIRVLPSGGVSRTLYLENFAVARRSLQRVVNWVQQKVNAERDKLDSRRSTKLTVLATINSKASLSHWASNFVNSTTTVRQRVARVHLRQSLLVLTRRMFTARELN